MSSKSKKKESPPGTVLLRQAEPKYKFVGKKLPKQPNEHVGNQGNNDSNQNLNTTKSKTSSKTKKASFSTDSTSSVVPESNIIQRDSPLSSSASEIFPHQNKSISVNSTTTTTLQGNKPVAIVGASQKSKPLSSPSWSGSVGTNANQTTPNSLSNSLSQISDSRERNSSMFNSSPLQSPQQRFTTLTSTPRSEFELAAPTTPNVEMNNHFPSTSIREYSISTTPVSTTSYARNQNTSSTTPPLSQNLSNDDNKETEQEEEEEEGSDSSSLFLDSTAAAAALSGVTHGMLSQRLVETERERDKLKKDLDAQLQVNSELKRLLVASVGDDLSKRVERLAEDRVQLSMDIGGLGKKMSEDYENLDKMSIQADMWRSKYLASRVMVEELGNARAFFSLQCHETQEVLQQMLNERHELRTNLLEAYKILQQVKDAFDPLNSHRSSSLTSTNVLDLSRACQKLGETVRFRLLPAHVATSSSSTVEIDLDSWADSVTRAEQYAHELLSRPSEPTGSLQSGSSSVLPVSRSPTMPRQHLHHCHHHLPNNQFHPQVKHENVTFHCCKCQGEIRVV